MLAQISMQVSGEPPSPRYGHSSVLLSPRKMILYGGTAGRTDLNDIHVFTVSVVYDAPIAPLPQTRSNMYFAVGNHGLGDHYQRGLVPADNPTWPGTVPPQPSYYCAQAH